MTEKSEKEALISILKSFHERFNHDPAVVEMSNKELALALVEEIWSDMSLGDRKEALLFEATGRIYPDDL